MSKRIWPFADPAKRQPRGWAAASCTPVLDLDLRPMGGEMKRLSIAVVFITALIMFAATASAARPVERIPVDSQVLLCNGDWLHVTGTELVRSAVTTTPSGALLIAYHLNSQGISGIDPTTGTVYHSTGGTNETDLFPPSGGAVFTFLNRLHLQATGGAQSVIIRWVEHLTITPGGTVTANVSKFSASC